MKYLIVNGDDFGGSHGINRGILEAHRDGILTSASLFVDRVGSEEAAALAHEAPRLSVGLHADLDALPPERVRGELLRQLARFEVLVGRPPTHLDSHHNVHRLPDVRADVLAVAAEHNLMVRDFSKVRYVSEFYGQASGRTDLASISPPAFVELLRTRVEEEGLTEFGCHPGYVDSGLVSGYRTERECELRTLCDPSLREAIRDMGVALVSFSDVPHILNNLATEI